MFHAWILFSPLLLGASSFMIHNTYHRLCLEDSAATGHVLLKICNLDSESQQWVWINQGMLMSAATSRCLSTQQRESVQTLQCRGPKVDAAAFMWDCDRDMLISRNTSMLLSTDGRQLIITHDSKHSKWRSLDEGSICQERLRSRRASDPGKSDASEKQTEELDAMTEEEKAYLRWFYRTEDQTTWTFVLLGLAFFCLLVGFLLLGMGAMANKNRKKIAKYKAAAAKSQRSGGEEMMVISAVRDDDGGARSLPIDIQTQASKASPSNGGVGELGTGDIMVTWKDGNTSCLYPDPAAGGVDQEEEVVTEVDADEKTMAME
ncbi:solute carrier family 51 subunit beta [Antennarius striatus]|uniref:solute carrier family 51 subunit beta n=1 Tax=Antennarius striatus TaxID=241820 RepID=UPI0035B2CD55